MLQDKYKYLLLFSISLIGFLCLGFSVFVISENPKLEGNIDVVMGDVSSADKVSINSVDKKFNRICFGPENGDVTGRLISDNSNNEQLKIVFTGEIDKFDKLNYVEAKLTFDNEQDNKTINTMVDCKYIELPVFDKLYNSSLTNNNYQLEGSYWINDVINNTRKFSFYSSFKWGEFFCHMNPSEFFDSTEFNGIKRGVDYTLIEAKQIIDKIYLLNSFSYKIVINTIV